MRGPGARLAFERARESMEALRSSLAQEEGDGAMWGRLSGVLAEACSRWPRTFDRESILQGCARAGFVSEWANGVEAGAIEGDAARCGTDWLDVAPREIDPAATAWAARVVRAFESGCGRSIVEACEVWADACGGDDLKVGGCGLDGMDRIGAARFGWYLGMEAMGHGVGLRDDVTADEGLPAWVDAPYCEFSYFEFAEIEILETEEEG